MRCSGIGKQQHVNSLLWFQKGSVFFQWIRSWFLFVETRLESQHVACKVATFIWISQKWRNEPPNCQNLIGKFGTGKYRIFKPTHVHFDLCPAVFVLGFSHQQMCFQGEVHFHAPIDTVGIWEGFVSLVRCETSTAQSAFGDWTNVTWGAECLEHVQFVHVTNFKDGRVVQHCVKDVLHGPWNMFHFDHAWKWLHHKTISFTSVNKWGVDKFQYQRSEVAVDPTWPTISDSMLDDSKPPKISQTRISSIPVFAHYIPEFPIIPCELVIFPLNNHHCWIFLASIPCLHQWIGLREHLQELLIFHRKNHCFFVGILKNQSSDYG